MNIFQIPENGIITINNIEYNIKEVSPDILDKPKQPESKPEKIIDNTKGVYIFILKEDMPNFNKTSFNSEVTGVFFQQKQYPLIKEIGIPPFTKEKPKKDCIFYVGSAGQIISRLKEHWNNDKINGCTSLKLGFPSRKWIKTFLKVYIITSCVNPNDTFNHKQLEKDIRTQYGASFGK